MVFIMSLQATLWRSVIILEMIVVNTLRKYGDHYLLAGKVDKKAGGHFKADSVFLIKKGACAVVEDIALHLDRQD